MGYEVDPSLTCNPDSYLLEICFLLNSLWAARYRNGSHHDFKLGYSRFLIMKEVWTRVGFEVLNANNNYKKFIKNSLTRSLKLRSISSRKQANNWLERRMLVLLVNSTFWFLIISANWNLSQPSRKMFCRILTVGISHAPKKSKLKKHFGSTFRFLFFYSTESIAEQQMSESKQNFISTRTAHSKPQ